MTRKPLTAASTSLSPALVAWLPLTWASPRAPAPSAPSPLAASQPPPQSAVQTRPPPSPRKKILLHHWEQRPNPLPGPGHCPDARTVRMWTLPPVSVNSRSSGRPFLLFCLRLFLPASRSSRSMSSASRSFTTGHQPRKRRQRNRLHLGAAPSRASRTEQCSGSRAPRTMSGSRSSRDPAGAELTHRVSRRLKCNWIRDEAAAYQGWKLGHQKLGCGGWSSSQLWTRVQLPSDRWSDPNRKGPRLGSDYQSKNHGVGVQGDFSLARVVSED